jgi:hypothetical protein
MAWKRHSLCCLLPADQYGSALNIRAGLIETYQIPAAVIAVVFLSIRALLAESCQLALGTRKDYRPPFYIDAHITTC